MRQGNQLSASDVTQLLKRIYDRARRALRATGCCSSDAVTAIPPQRGHLRPPAPRPSPATYTASTSSATVSESGILLRPWGAFGEMPSSRPVPVPWSCTVETPGPSSQQPYPRPYGSQWDTYDVGTSSSRDPGTTPSQSRQMAPGKCSCNTYILRSSVIQIQY